MDWKMLFKIHMCYHNSENIWNKEFFCDILFYKSEFVGGDYNEKVYSL